MSDYYNSYPADYKGRRTMKKGSVSGGIYGLAFVGALVYYLYHATTFASYVLGFLKALVWPAILVYRIMEFLKM